MIRIHNITPLDNSSSYKKIEDLELDYLKCFRKFIQPENLLDNFITTKKSRNYIAKTADLPLLRYLKNHFSDVILSKPHDLFKIINKFNSKGWQVRVHNGKKTTLLGNELLYIFGYKERFRDASKRGIWLAQQLNIKTCPYCNAQATIVVTAKTQKLIAKLQFDHFFAKSEFPYLSISLYNLIPSCGSCNITKGSKPLNLLNHYHPYSMDLSLYFKFYLKYNPDPKLLTLGQIKNQNLQIILRPKFSDPNNLIKNHDGLYHLEGIYNRYQDIAEELLIKAIIYSQNLISGHLKIEGLFPDKQVYLRYLLGTYSQENQMLDRPLSKFIQDLAKQLKLY